MLQIALKPGLTGGSWAMLRPLCGKDEASIGSHSVAATALLDRLLIETPGTCVAPGKAQELAVCDCDRLLAALYMQYFGDNVEGTTTCRECRKPFELRFSLKDLMADQSNFTSGKAVGPDAEGLYTLSDGRRFRLPTAGDQHRVMGLEPEQAAQKLLACCVVEGQPTADPTLLQSAMEEVGALLKLDLDAACTECESVQQVRFDIQTYLLRVLAAERRLLNREIHTLALTYGWSHNEILNLTRDDRRAFVRLIEAGRAVVAPRRARL